jgi:hypothetical protein
MFGKEKVTSEPQMCNGIYIIYMERRSTCSPESLPHIGSRAHLPDAKKDKELEKSEREKRRLREREENVEIEVTEMTVWK